jgi:phosphate butyryltransferase
MTHSFDALIKKANRIKKKKKIVVAAADDEETLEAIAKANKAGIIDPTLVGNRLNIVKFAKKIKLNISKFKIIDESNPEKIAKLAVRTATEDQADILMKGLMNTSIFLKAVLNKEFGLKEITRLSHLAILEIPEYHQLLVITDPAINIAPNIDQKIAIINNAVRFLNKIGVNDPKVAIASSNEIINTKMESSMQAAILTMMNKRGQIKNCTIDGPLALDNIVSKEACLHKGIKTQVGGNANVVVAPEIDSGNILIKSLIFFSKAEMASIVMGAPIPIILTSRADKPYNKYLSIICAALA